ncbi:MAG: O-antigen ligase family protein [Phycisphaerae bacterium]
MTAARPIASNPSARRTHLARALETLAVVLLLAGMAARPFLAEMSYRTLGRGLLMDVPAGQDNSPKPLVLSVDRQEVARVTFPLVIFLAGAAWLAGRASVGCGPIRFRAMGVMLAAFAALTVVSVLRASDKRMALDAWIEQVSLIASAFIAAQLFADRRRMVLLLVVMAGVGATLALKAYVQYFVEIPERIEQFRLYHDEQLAQIGITPNTPQAAAFANRIADRSATGFFGLANMFAAALIPLLAAAVGLAADKLVAALRSLSAWRRTVAKGEVHVPTLAAVVTCIIPLLILPALLLTHSRGGSTSGLLACAATGVVYWRRRFLAAHWKVALAAVGGVFLLGAMAVVAYGLRYDGLPGKSLTFRWYYWTASAKIAAEHPLWGVGPANFPSAYLAVRRPEAEEAVKMPHNVVAQALAEYGLPGGVCYLAMIGYVLVLSARPRRGDDCGLRIADCGLPSPPGLAQSAGIRNPQSAIRNSSSARFPSCGPSPWLLVLIAAAVPLARVLFGGSADDSALLIYDAILPTIVLAGMLALAAWFGGRLLDAGDTALDVSRIALACGLAGFVLHNMVEFGLFVPGAAAVFWLAAGAALASKDVGSREWGVGSGEWEVGREEAPSANGSNPTPHSPLPTFVVRHLPVLAALAVTVAAMMVLWRPVVAKTALLGRMVADNRKGDYQGAWLAAREAIAADPLDPQPPSEAATLPMQHPDLVPDQWRAACDLALQAARRDPLNFSYWQRAAEAGWYEASPDSYYYAWPTRQAQSPKAAEELRRVLAGKDDPASLARLAGVEYAQGDFKAATDLMIRAVQKAPDSAVLRIELGNAFYRAGQTEPARNAWREAAGMVKPTFRPLPAGDSGAMSREPATYLECMARAVRLDPNDCRLRINYANMLCWNGHARASLEQIDRALWLNGKLTADSIERLSPAELAEIDTLRARAECLAGSQPRDSD